MVRARAFFATTDGVILTMGIVPIVALALLWMPMSGELMLASTWLFYQLYVNPGHADPKKKSASGQIKGKHRVYDFPFRVPFSAKRFDGSYAEPKLGSGITFLGREISTKLEIWSGDSDLRTHMLVLGTTGSGKTEFLLGLVFNALIQNSGFIYTDGKGAVDLYQNVFRLARYLGREEDLLVVNFLTSGRDFLDKQFDRTTNTMNPFALGSSGMLIELIISLMDDSGGGGDMWKGRAIAFVAGLTRVLCYLRDRGYILLDSNKFIEFFELPVVESVVFDKKITIDGRDITITDPLFDKVLEPLRAFILTLPGYSKDKKGAQEQKTLEQHGFITMQLTRLFGDLSFTYGYIFQTLLGEVDMYDVVINRRILVVLLPALERAPDSLKMLGKLIVGSIKQMMAGCLGNRLEGSVREIVDARPTNAAVPFYVVLDEYGYYAVLGFAVAPAQARSLGFPQPLRSRVKIADGVYKTIGEMMPGDELMLPDGGKAKVREIRLTGQLPVAALRTSGGRRVEAAYAHHWPVRVHGQTKIMTTREIDHFLKSGIEVELAVADVTGLRYEGVVDISFVGIEATRCLVVEHDLHCYVTDGDLVTHNCITFAAQDFSSLQKASKEEADATWENTNVRVVGRITSGVESETWRRIAGVGSEASVHEGGRKEHDPGTFSGGYRSNLDANVGRAKRIEYDDLAQQQDGEFTFLVGKKQSTGVGGVRVIRARTFYTAVTKRERPPKMRVNHFLKVEPPRSGGPGDQDMETIETLERVIAEALKGGALKEVFPNNPTELIRTQSFYKMGLYIREAQSRARLPLDQAIRVAFLCDEREAEVMASAAAQAPVDEATLDTGLSETSERLAAIGEENSGSGVDQIGAVRDAEAADAREEELAIDIPLDETESLDGSEGPAGDDFSLSLADHLGDTGRDPIAGDAVATDSSAQDDILSLGSGDGLALEELDEASVSLPHAETTAVVKKKDEQKGEGEKSGSSSGGMSVSLVPPNSKPVDADADASVPAIDAKAAVIDYLDAYDFGDQGAEGVGGDSRDGEAQSGKSDQTVEEPRRTISVLTLRVLNTDDEPSEISSYLADQIAATETALGVNKDSLAIQADARRQAEDLERITSYVDGPTPSAPTLQEWDETVEGLADAAERNPPNYL